MYLIKKKKKKKKKTNVKQIFLKLDFIFFWGEKTKQNLFLAAEIANTELKFSFKNRFEFWH